MAVAVDPRSAVALDASRPAVPPRRAARPSVALVVWSAAVGLVFAGPLLYLLYRNAVLGGNVVDTLTSEATLGPLARTLTLAVTVSLASAVLGTGLAWLTTRTDVPGARVWRVVLPVPLAIPSFVGAAALVAAFARGGLLEGPLGIVGVDRLPAVQGLAGAAVVLTLLTYPYVYLPVAARLRGLPPSLEENARLLGRPPWAVFRTIVLPQASTAIWAGTLLVFLYCLAEFGAVQILRFDTLTRAIYASRLSPATSVPLSLVLGLLAVAVVAGERALARRRPAVQATRAKRPLVLRLGRWRWAALAVLATTVLLALVAPVAVLGHWALRGVTAGSSGIDGADVGRAVWNTVLVSTLTAVLATIVVLPVAELTARRRSRLGEVPNALVVAGFALPGLVIALAIVFWVLQLPAGLGLYQTLPMLLLAYVVHFGAHAMRASQVAVAGVSRQVRDAAQVLGASRARRFLTVEAPLMLPGLLAGAGMVLLSVMKELPATLLLAPTGFDTLATRIWQASSEGFLAETGLTSIVLIALSGVLTWALVLRRAERP